MLSRRRCAPGHRLPTVRRRGGRSADVLPAAAGGDSPLAAKRGGRCGGCLCAWGREICFFSLQYLIIQKGRNDHELKKNLYHPPPFREGGRGKKSRGNPAREDHPPPRR